MKKWEEITLPFTHGIETESQIISKISGTFSSTTVAYGSPIADTETWEHFWENGEREYVKSAKWNGLTKKEQLEARLNGGTFKGTPLCNTIAKGSILDNAPDEIKAKIKKIYTAELEKEGHKDWFVCCDYEYEPGLIFQTTIFGADCNSVSFKILELVAPPCNKISEIQWWMTFLFEHSFKALDGTNCAGILSTGINPVQVNFVSGMTCGDHHHLGKFKSAVEKIKVYNFIRNYLPHLVALSANSSLFNSCFYENKGVEGRIKKIPEEEPVPAGVRTKFFTIGAAQSIRLKFNQNQLNFTPYIPIKEVNTNNVYPYFQNHFKYDDLHTVAINPFKGREKAIKDLHSGKDTTKVEAEIIKDGTIEIRIFDSQLSTSRRIAFVALIQAMALHAIRMDDIPEVSQKSLEETYSRAIEQGLFGKLKKDETISNPTFKLIYNTDMDSPRILNSCHNLLESIKGELMELGYLDLPILNPFFASIYGTEKFEPPLNSSLAQLWIYYKEKEKPTFNFQHVVNKIMQMSQQFNTKYISNHCEVIEVFGIAKQPPWLEQKIKLNIDNSTNYVPHEEIKYNVEIENIQDTPLEKFAIIVNVFEKDTKKIIQTENLNITPLKPKEIIKLECKCIPFPDFDSYYIISLEIVSDYIKLVDSSKQKRITIRPIPLNVTFHYGPKMIYPTNIIPILAHLKHGIDSEEKMHITTKLLTAPTSTTATKEIAVVEKEVTLNNSNQDLDLDKDFFSIKPPLVGFSSSIKANVMMVFKIKSFEFHKLSEPFTIMYKPPTIKDPIIEVLKNHFVFGESLPIKIKLQSDDALNQTLKLKLQYVITEEMNKEPVFELEKDILLKDSSELTIYDIPSFILDQKKLENSPKLIIICAVISAGIQIALVKQSIEIKDITMDGNTVDVIFSNLKDHQSIPIERDYSIMVQIRFPKEPISRFTFSLFRSGDGVPITQIGTVYELRKKKNLLTSYIRLDHNTPYLHWELLQENVGIRHIVKEGAFHLNLIKMTPETFPKFAINAPNLLMEGIDSSKTQIIIDNDTNVKYEDLNLLVRVLSVSKAIFEQNFKITVNSFSTFAQNFSFLTPLSESKNPFDNIIRIQAQLSKNGVFSDLKEKPIPIKSSSEKPIFKGNFSLGAGRLTMVKEKMNIKGTFYLNIEAPISKALLCEVFYTYVNNLDEQISPIILKSKIDPQLKPFQVTRDFNFTTPDLAHMKENEKKLKLSFRLRYEGDVDEIPENKIQIQEIIIKLY